MSYIKAMLLGHWDTTSGQNFIYVYLNQVIKKMIWIGFTPSTEKPSAFQSLKGTHHPKEMPGRVPVEGLRISDLGHGGPALVGNVYLEGKWSECHPGVSRFNGL